MGESLDMVVQMCKDKMIAEDQIYPIGSKPTEEQFNDLIAASATKTTIIAIGNMGAGGAELSKYFENIHLNNNSKTNNNDRTFSDIRHSA